MPEPWSRGDKIALVGVLLGAMAVFAALVVIPEVRRTFRLLDDRPESEQPAPRQTTIDSSPTRNKVQQSQVARHVQANKSTQNPVHLDRISSESPPDDNTSPVPKRIEPTIHRESSVSVNRTPSAGVPRADDLGSSQRVEASSVSLSSTGQPSTRDDPGAARNSLVGDAPLSDAHVIRMLGTGYIPGLSGRLNPIRDDSNRAYLYADNIAIAGGKIQPVTFALNEPFVLEDAEGNRFQLRVLSIDSKVSVIEYRRQLLLAPKASRPFRVMVIDESSNPLSRAEVHVSFSDGTYVESRSDANGMAVFPAPKSEAVTIYAAHRTHAGLVQHSRDAGEISLMKMADPTKGSVIINSTGYIPGLEGRLNPILDEGERRYLYANDIEIDNGKEQPADFQLRRPVILVDKRGTRMRVEIIAMEARSSLVEFSKVPN